MTVDAGLAMIAAQLLNLDSIGSVDVRTLRPDRLIELSGTDLNVGVYPSDIAISRGIDEGARNDRPTSLQGDPLISPLPTPVQAQSS